MPKNERSKTRYPGVFSYQTKGGKKKFSIRYRRSGEAKVIEEATTAQTASQASQIRARRISGELSRKEKLEAERAERAAAEGVTVFSVWQAYLDRKGDYPSKAKEDRKFSQWVAPVVGGKYPPDITKQDVDAIFQEAVDKGKKRSGVYALELLRRAINFGAVENLHSPLSFKIKVPALRNEKTEYLTEEQFQKLVQSAFDDKNKAAGGIVLTAIMTGMRQGAIFSLEWDDILWDQGFILLRNGKARAEGEVDKIPLPDALRPILEAQPRTSKFVFPGKGGEKRDNISRPWNRIRERAGLPWLRFHGLRHVYATMLASSGQVDIRELQKLLTHRSLAMTMRYSHLTDSALKKAAGVASDLVSGAMNRKK